MHRLKVNPRRSRIDHGPIANQMYGRWLQVVLSSLNRLETGASAMNKAVKVVELST